MSDLITIEVNGQQYTNFVSISVRKSLVDLCDAFTFTASSVSGFPPFKIGDEVTIYINTKLELVGFIEKINGNATDNSHSVTYSGRDKTCDFLDSSINQVNEIKADESLTLKRIIEIIRDDLGSQLQVIDELDAPPFNKAEDIIKPNPADNAFDFSLKFARKRQAILSSTIEGNILISDASPEAINAILISKVKSDSNNVLSESWNVDDTRRFNRYIFKSQNSLVALNQSGDAENEGIVNRKNGFIDETIRKGRQRVTKVASYGHDELQKRAEWAGKIAKSEAIQYTCTVKGFAYDTANLWQTNKLVKVDSERADIDREMLIKTLEFTQSESEEGKSAFSTTLNLVDKDAFILKTEEENAKQRGKLTNAFV